MKDYTNQLLCIRVIHQCIKGRAGEPFIMQPNKFISPGFSRPYRLFFSELLLDKLPVLTALGSIWQCDEHSRLRSFKPPSGGFSPVVLIGDLDCHSHSLHSCLPLGRPLSVVGRFWWGEFHFYQESSPIDLYHRVDRAIHPLQLDCTLISSNLENQSYLRLIYLNLSNRCFLWSSSCLHFFFDFSIHAHMHT